jgi:hypothetical protein
MDMSAKQYHIIITAERILPAFCKSVGLSQGTVNAYLYYMPVSLAAEYILLAV